jgi:hypothetical protein
MGSTLDHLTVTLPDVAALAHVQRPVVSMWRTRYASGAHPFPAPVATVAGSPRFRASDVAAWVEATGLGNNAHFAADLGRRAALADLAGLSPRVAFDGFTALLCLSTVVDERLSALSRAELLDLADEADPDDAFLYTEVAALGRDAGRFAEHAELVVGAAYSAADAVERALADRARLDAPDLTDGALGPAAVDLVATVAVALAGTLPGRARVGDPHPGCGDLVAGVLRAWGEGRGGGLPRFVLGRPRPDDGAARLARRRLSAAHVPFQDAADDPFELPGPGVVVTQLPPVGAAWSDTEVLAALDDVALGMAPGQRAVVVGPASALTDALRDPESERVRAALLRTDRVRSVVRLPEGLVPSRARSHLALWVLGDAHPRVPIGDRWTIVADLSSERPDAGPSGGFAPAVVHDLVSDVLAAQGSYVDVHAHTFRFARFARTRELLASGGDLVASGRPFTRGSRPDDGATAERLHALLAATPGELPVVRAQVAASSAEGQGPRTARLGDLAASGAVAVVPGNRLDPADVGVGGEVRVVGVPELTGDGAWGARRVDRLAFAARYEAGRLTEPGDVVFTTTPYPAAVVDAEGLSVVEYPARVLRLAPGGAAPAAGLVARVVAADVSDQPATAKRWRAWDVRLVEPAEAGALEALLDDVAARREALEAELARLDEVARLAASGVTGGSVRLTVQNATGETTGEKN